VALAAVQEVEAPSTAVVSPEKVDYVKSLFTDVLEVNVPQKLEVFLAVLQASGFTLLGRDEWRKLGGDLHPFLMPLAYTGEGADVEVIGLMVRTPNGGPLRPEEYQVVSQRLVTSLQVVFRAFDMEKYMIKRAEEAAFRKEKQDKPLIEATKDLYEVRFSGKDQTALDKWLLLEVGAFPDVYKNLAMEHIKKGDPQSGLIVADTMRDVFGFQWGFPHAFCCKVLRDHFDGRGKLENRDVEADHCAERCFKTGYPLWTLDPGTSLQDLLCEAKMHRIGDLDTLRVFYLQRAADDQRAAVRTGSMSLGCATLAKCQALMDAVVCGHKSYNGVRKELRDLYEEIPGCDPVMQMIDYFSSDAAPAAA